MPEPARPDLPPFAGALRSGAAYPHRPASVDVAETPSSLVFLAGDLVYKVKKPVNLGFLDYSTVDKRRHCCEEEIRLNRRYAPDWYLGVVPVLRTPDGDYRVEAGEGEVIDHAVKMRRLPESGMLDQVLRRGELTEADAVRIADRLAEVHRDAERGPGIDAYGRIEVIAANLEENFAQMEPFVGHTIAAATLDAVAAWSQAFLGDRASLFEARIAEGRIRDCHGDLHARNVCLTDGIVFYDCIEFNERFRYSDVASDLAFLVMELDVRGAGRLASVLAARYMEAAGDPGLAELLPFYSCYRAFVRGKVASLLFGEAEAVAEKAAARAEAERYFGLARAYAEGLVPPAVVMLHGLPGSGKSTVAGRLAAGLDAAWLGTDVTRRATDPAARPGPYGAGSYAPEARLAVYETLGDAAAAEVDRFRPVVLDAGFRTHAQRQAVLDRLRGRDLRLVVVECSAPRDELERRLRERQAAGGSISDAGPDVLDGAMEELEPPEDLTGAERVTILTPGPWEAAVDSLIERLRRHNRWQTPERSG